MGRVKEVIKLPLAHDRRTELVFNEMYTQNIAQWVERVSYLNKHSDLVGWKYDGGSLKSTTVS